MHFRSKLRKYVQIILFLALVPMWRSVFGEASGGFLKGLMFSRRFQGNVFIVLLDLSLRGCFDSCRYRRRCSFFNYHRRWTRCELIEGDESTGTLVVKSGFVCSKRVLWQQDTDSDCTACSEKEACAPRSDPVCSVQECGPPETPMDPGLVALGNTWSLMRNVRYVCPSGSPDVIPYRVTTCLATGFWSAVDTSCGCPRSWIQLEDHCYLFSAVALHWWDSERYCQYQLAGSHLVYLETSAENALVVSAIETGTGGATQSNYWIGGNDLQTEDKFVWGYPSGSQVTFTNWASGEPNDWKGNENCVMLVKSRSYKWNDSKCVSRSMRFICEFP